MMHLSEMLHILLENAEAFVEQLDGCDESESTDSEPDDDNQK